MKGASINEADKNGETPLHLASWGGHFGILQDLINNGANIGTKDSSGKTPLDIARDKGHNNIVNYLEEELNKEREKPVQRRRRHHHGNHNSHHLSRKLLATDLSNQPEIAASSGTRQSSWINGLFVWVKSSVNGLVSSVVNKISTKELENSKSGDTDVCSTGLEKMYSATIPQSRKSLGAPKGNIPNRSWSLTRKK